MHSRLSTCRALRVATSFAVVGAVGALAPRIATSQTAAAVPIAREVSDTICARPAFRRFDYWAGDWVVKDSTGKVIGRNSVTRDVGGCALHEHWSTGTGEIGESFTTYAPLEGKWHQLYVGSGGYIIAMSGNFDGDKLVLMTTPHPSFRDPKIQVVERWTWTPLDSSRVRQTAAVSRDGGKTWIKQFDGFYERAGR
jgi:hypothetical protein